MNNTINYYNQNAENFIANTQNADMHPTQERFLRLLDANTSILDFGCGSGRDTKYFLEKGYRVTATDGSSELCRLASEFTGIKVKEMLFQELDAMNQYDGIWACSSILHLPKKELLPVILTLSTHFFLLSSYPAGSAAAVLNLHFVPDTAYASLHSVR